MVELKISKGGWELPSVLQRCVDWEHIVSYKISKIAHDL